MLHNLLASLLGVTSILYTGSIPFPTNAINLTEAPFTLSQLQPWHQTYQCGNFAVTLSEQGKNKYTYQAVNAKGQGLTLNNGTEHSGRNSSSIYSFDGEDGSQYVLEDYGGGKAALSISKYPEAGVTYDCTTDGT